MPSEICHAGLIRRVSQVLTLLCSAVLPAAAQGTSQPENRQAVRKDATAEAMDAIRSGDYLPAHVHHLADVRAVQAIPGLEDRFALEQDKVLKTSIASALVKLGDKDRIYWNYLVNAATEAIGSDAPYPTKFDANGKLVPGVSSEFANWARAHNMTVDSAVNEAAFYLPGAVLLLGDAGDRRAVPLLRRGLDSPNFTIQAYAAAGLAQLHDTASIPLIIAACERAPTEAAAPIASSLRSFNDPEA